MNIFVFNRLQSKGTKTLRERTRLQQIDLRMDELNRDITGLRLKLSGKPA